MVNQETRLGYGVTGRPETPGKANAQFRRRSKAGSDKVQWDLWVIFYKCKDNNGNGWISLLPLNLTYPRCIDSAASHLEGMGLEGVDIQVLVGDVTHWWMMGDNSSKLTCFIFCLNSNKLLCRLMMYWWDSTTTAQSEQIIFSPWKVPQFWAVQVHWGSAGGGQGFCWDFQVCAKSNLAGYASQGNHLI